MATGKGFGDVYTDVCYRYGTCPYKFAKHFLDAGVLNIKAERVKTEDWTPLLETIQDNRSLRCIAIRNTYNITLNFKSNIANQKERLKLIPAINKREIVRKLSETLKIVLRSSKVLECIILENVLFAENDIGVISEGLVANKSLKYISFENCRLGNKNFEVICNSVKNSMSLTCVNFSNCNLTWTAMEKLKTLIEHQSVLRHGNMWEKTLRYQNPELNLISGLKEVNLNNNPAIGDRGIEILAKSLVDDLWIREIHLQNCGVTDDGGKILHKLLNSNSSLSAINIQDNAFQNEAIYQELKVAGSIKEKWENRYFSIEPPNQTKYPLPAFKTGLLKKSPLEKSRKSQSNRNREIKCLEKQNDELKIRVAQLSKQLENERNEHFATKKKLEEIDKEISQLKSALPNRLLDNVDDSVLVAIETTFKRFQEFINLIKSSNLEHFIKVPPDLFNILPQNHQSGDFSRRNAQQFKPSNQTGSNLKELSKELLDVHQLQNATREISADWISIQRHFKQNNDKEQFRSLSSSQSSFQPLSNDDF